MKKIVLSFVILLICSYSFTQSNLSSITKGAFVDEAYNYPIVMPFNQENINTYKIETVTKITHYKGIKNETTERFSKDGKLIEIDRVYKKHRSSLKYQYNSDGKVIKMEFKSSKSSTIINYDYDVNGNVTLVKTINSKGQKSTLNNRYDEDKRLVEREFYDFKGKYSGNKYTYNEGGFLVQHQVFKNDKLNPIKTLDYAYYANGSIKSTVFKEKKKVKYVWNFDCKPEGELLNSKEKDVSTICIKEEIHADGSRVVWNREFDENGALTKVQTVFDKDSLVINRKFYNESDKLTFEYLRREDDSILRTSYDKKGNVLMSEEFLFNQDKKPIKQERKGNKYNYTFLFNYEGNLKTSVIRIYKKSIYIDEFQYEYFN